MDPDETARACAAVMWRQDRASQALGMSLDAVAAGRATMSMTVRPDMVNGWAIAHGGLVATLADSAFAFACNSRDEVTVAAGIDVVFVASAYEGDLLVAHARERVRRGRSGVYDVTVRRGAEPDAEVVAEVRGRSRSLGRPVLDPAR